MAVFAVTRLQVQPDGSDALTGQARTYKTMLERHGAHNVRMVSAVVAWTATGTMALIVGQRTPGLGNRPFSEMIGSLSGPQS